MQDLPGTPQSLWLASTETPPMGQALSGQEFDTVIVGGGIVGVALAHMLSVTGMKVALLEATRLLSGVTGCTTAKLTSLHGLQYGSLKSGHGAEKARLYHEANEWGIRFVKESSFASKCDFQEDFALTYATTDRGLESLKAEAGVCEELAIPTELVSEPNLPFPCTGALVLHGQARYHPLKFLLALVEEAQGRGVSFYDRSRVLKLEEEKEGCVLGLETGEVRAEQVVVCTHYPIYDSGAFVTKLAPYRSYAMACEVERTPDGMGISAEEGDVGSFRRASLDGSEVLICGQGHHKVGQAADTTDEYRRLFSWADETFGVRSVRYRWSTQDNWSVDGVPFIGRSPKKDRVYLATGFGGWGMAQGYAAARLLADLLTGVSNPWARLYDPSRTDWAMAGEMLKENINVAQHFFGDRMKRAAAPEDIPPGEGAVVNSAEGRLAVHRNEAGQLFAVKPNCTHLGCQVAWNSAERTWDCPCHGSRFAYDGRVLHAPAVAPLEQVALGSDDPA